MTLNRISMFLSTLTYIRAMHMSNYNDNENKRYCDIAGNVGDYRGLHWQSIGQMQQHE